MEITNKENSIKITQNEYQIEITLNCDSINITIQNNNSLFQSNFGFNYLNKFQFFNGQKSINSIFESILTLIKQNNIQLDVKQHNLKLILIPNLINIANIELILNKQYKLSEIKIVKIIDSHSKNINAIGIFPSGKFVLVSSDQKIIIYDINYTLLQQIQNAHYLDITYIYIKDENNFITCSFDRSIKIWKKNENNFFFLEDKIEYAHSQGINKVTSHSNGNLISFSTDIKIWEKINNKYQLMLIICNCYVQSFLLLNDKNLLISSGNKGTKFWNSNNFKLINYFIYVNCSNNIISRIDKNNIIIGENNILIIISLLKYQVIQKIKISKNCLSVKALTKKRVLFIGIKNYILIYKSDDNYEYIQKKYTGNEINGFFELNDNLIGTYSNNGIINIWKI